MLPTAEFQNAATLMVMKRTNKSRNVVVLSIVTSQKLTEPIQRKYIDDLRSTVNAQDVTNIHRTLPPL